MNDMRHWLVLGKGEDDETFVVWSEEDAAAYGFAREQYRVDGPFVAEAEQEKLLDLLEKIAQECMTLGEVDVVWIGTQARLAVDRHRLGEVSDA